ncbi:hypothetical protein Tco_1073351, partial [Tanacetum coccineum]
IYWKSSDEEDDDEVNVSEDDDDLNDDNADKEGDDDQEDNNEHTKLDNDDDDLVHPKLSTFEEKERQYEEDKEEEWSDDEAYDDETQGVNVEGEELDKEQTYEDDEANELYRDMNVNLEGTFEARVKALEDNFSEFQQTNQFATTVSLIPSIVDTKIIKKQVKEQVSKILLKIEKFVNDQLEAEVLTRSSNQAKTSHVVATNLSELELKKILIDKMDNNKSIDKSIQQKTLYNALVDAYKTDKDILETYGDTVTFKIRRDDEDKDEEPSIGSNRGTLAQNEDPREPFNEMMDTPLDFSAFMMNRLKVDTLTPELLAGLTYELMKGSCKSLVELEYFLEEVCKATTDQLD